MTQYDKITRRSTLATSSDAKQMRTSQTRNNHPVSSGTGFILLTVQLVVLFIKIPRNAHPDIISDGFFLKTDLKIAQFDLFLVEFTGYLNVLATT